MTTFNRKLSDLFGRRVERVLSFQNGKGASVSIGRYRPRGVGEMLITSGMHEVEMKIPDNAPVNSRIELIAYLNKFDPRYADRLRLNSDFPFVDRTCLSHGDTVDWGFSIVDDDRSVDLFIFNTYEKHQAIRIDDHGNKADFLVMIPLFPEELAFKRENGLAALLNAFDEYNVPLQADAKRDPIC